jgi:hypothetical protein
MMLPSSVSEKEDVMGKQKNKVGIVRVPGPLGRYAKEFWVSA